MERTALRAGIAAGLGILSGALSVVGGLFGFISLGAGLSLFSIGEQARIGLFSGGVYLLGLMAVACGVGLLRGLPWARPGLIGAQAATLALWVGALFVGGRFNLLPVVFAIAVLLLLSPLDPAALFNRTDAHNGA